MDIKKLFALADRAKTIGGGQDYALPNAIFCVLLDLLFKGGEEAQNLILELETQDFDGEYADEAYYDLFVLRLTGGERELELAIPAPLLDTVTAMALTKRAMVVARNEHGRVHQKGKPDEMMELWEKFHEEVSVNHLYEVVHHFLTPEALVAAGFEEVDYLPADLMVSQADLGLTAEEEKSLPDELRQSLTAGQLTARIVIEYVQRYYLWPLCGKFRKGVETAIRRSRASTTA